MPLSPRTLIVVLCMIIYRTLSLSSKVSIHSLPVSRVAVIGAGAAGLISAAILRRDGMNVTVYEQKRFVGGVWKYNPNQVLYK